MMMVMVMYYHLASPNFFKALATVHAPRFRLLSIKDNPLNDETTKALAVYAGQHNSVCCLDVSGCSLSPQVCTVRVSQSLSDG